MIDFASIALFAQAGPTAESVRASLFWYLGWLGFWMLPLSVFWFVGCYLFSLPLRRQERARLFLDLLELNLKDGRSAEQAICSVAQSRERSVGLRFHLLAAHLEEGLRLPDALERVPNYLPPPVRAMLKVGAELGDLLKVLPACRTWLGAGTTLALKAQHYLILLLLVTPAWCATVNLFAVFIWPKFNQIMLDMDFAVAAPMFYFLMDNLWLTWLSLLIPLGLLLGAILYVGGPRVAGWSRFALPHAFDWLPFVLPWRRKRMQRDFSAMLAVLLDAGVPEGKAVTLAAECTSNHVFKLLAAQTVEDLKQGAKLTEAVRHLDDAGEFRWRLSNAARGHGGFLAALRGWHEALDAKAFQQEQTATQLLTTGIVLLNGAVTAIMVVGVFQMFTGMITEAALW